MKKEIRNVDEKKCYCGKFFFRPIGYSNDQWVSRKHCSVDCARNKYTEIRLRQWQKPEYKQMMSKAHLGQKAWNKGIKQPEFSGKNHPRWKGDSPLRKAIRGLFEYRQWRSDVMTRDKFSCVWCGSKENLEVDHFPRRFIDIFRKYEISNTEEAIKCSELWNINNGRTLCKNCHYQTKLKKNAKNN